MGGTWKGYKHEYKLQTVGMLSQSTHPKELPVKGKPASWDFQSDTVTGTFNSGTSVRQVATIGRISSTETNMGFISGQTGMDLKNRGPPQKVTQFVAGATMFFQNSK